MPTKKTKTRALALAPLLILVGAALWSVQLPPEAPPGPLRDQDADGVDDRIDNCPNLSNPTQRDTDWDGRGNHCDGDDDGDGVWDVLDNCPLEANPRQTHSLYWAKDSDRDRVVDACDNCPHRSNDDQRDSDMDGVGDACDPAGGHWRDPTWGQREQPEAPAPTTPSARLWGLKLPWALEFLRPLKS